ncbi:septum site-determining protein MinC [Natronocella acetinitrilica]|uniref:Probable septum site-determining protein MinC n=1 Tax=Natronocella acetinitrilica TaxID=414046 RepID=A0AAE3G9E4_9GAMM|nr:septum site-determining protein MinC [Natronocella acetinitrilica]MCP1676903.1 septum site-determining protein MinC [Natronocella acetinitrilica]
MTQAKQRRNPALELKGRMMTLTVLRLLDPSVEVLARELDERMRDAPDFFRHLPVILDVEAVDDSDLHLDLPGLVGLLRAREFLPVGIRGGADHWREAAREAGIGVFSGGSDVPAAKAQGARPQAVPEPGASATMLVKQPVRSGQQIYARGGDLVVLGAVSPGAELLADGNIHVYGSLHGRALAGVRGDREARIFCQKFWAELVSVAGTYSVSEQFEESVRGAAVQIALRDGDILDIQPL